MNDDTRFEDEMKHALHREAPSAGFTEHILALIQVQKQNATTHLASAPDRGGLTRPPRFSFAGLRDVVLDRGLFARTGKRILAGALALAVIAATIYYRRVQQEKAYQEMAQQEQARERVQGEAAKERLVLALRIAGSKLQLARKKIEDINLNQIDERQRETQPEKE